MITINYFMNLQSYFEFKLQTRQVANMDKRRNQFQQRGGRGGGPGDFDQIQLDRVDADGSEDDMFDPQQPTNVNNIFGGRDDDIDMDDYLLNGQNDTSIGLASLSNQGGFNPGSRPADNSDYFAQQPRDHQQNHYLRQPVGNQPRGNAIYYQRPNNARDSSPPQLKGEALMGSVNKLSNWGWSLHPRFLKLNKRGLSYFKDKPPGDMDLYKSVADVEAKREEYKPKYCVPLDAILAVEEISDAERAKYKKLAKGGDGDGGDGKIPAFKVVFTKNHLKAKIDMVPQSNEQSMAQLNLDDTMEEEKKDAADAGKNDRPPKGAKAWYFSLPSNRLGPPLKSWLVNISIFAKRANSSFKFSALVAQEIKTMQQKWLSNRDHRGSPNRAVTYSPNEEDSADRELTVNQGLTNATGEDEVDKAKKKGKDRLAKLAKTMDDGSYDSEEPSDGKGHQGYDEEHKHALDQEANSKNKLCRDTLRKFKGLEIAKGVQQSNKNANNQKQSNMSQADRDNTKLMVEAIAMQGEKKKEEKQNIEDSGWDLKFQKHVDYVINAQNDMSRNFLLSQRLLDHVGKFREKAKEEVVKIVDRLDQHDDDRTGMKNNANRRRAGPFQRIGQQENLDEATKETIKQFCDEDTKEEHHLGSTYYNEERKMIIKLTHPLDYIDYSLSEGDQNAHSERQEDGGYNNANVSILKNDDEIGKRQLMKQYARELLSQDVIFDAILFNSSAGSELQRLRVPLTTMIDYKGFRAMAIASVELDTLKPVLGFKEGIYVSARGMDIVYQDLRNIGIVLNLKENRHQTSASQQQQYKRIPISSFVQIFANTSGQKEEKQDEDQDEVLKNFFDFHFKDLEYDKDPQHYILRTSEIFPYDIDPLDSNMDNFHRDRVLRPELVCANEKSLRADTKKLPRYAQKNNKKSRTETRPPQAEKDNEDNTDAVDLNIANKFLREMKIPQLVDLLDSLIIIPIDSATLEEAFHIQGVNIRYLSNVASLSNLKHVKDLCITEMLARTLKRIFNKALSELILNNANRKKQNIEEDKKIDHKIASVSNPTYEALTMRSGSRYIQESTTAFRVKQEKELKDLQEKKQEILQEREELAKPMSTRINEWILDFLNVIFGVGEETRIFWEEVLLPEVSAHYNFSLRELYKFERNLIALYFCLCEQINLKVTEIHDYTMTPTNDQSSKAKMGHLQQRSINQLNAQQMSSAAYAASNYNGAQGGIGGANVASQKTQRLQQEQKEDSAPHKEFGKTSEPFGNARSTNFTFELVPKTRTYKFRNLMYSQIAQKFRDYKNNGCMDEAYETCKMRKHMLMCLRGEDGELSTKLDLCQLQLEERQWEAAQRMAKNALEELSKHNINILHAKAIQFQTILMQAHYMAGEFQIAEKAFTLALETLDQHWGPYHPLHINIYGIMAQLLILNQKYEDATYLYKASLRCCMRILGPNHIQTGEVHMEYARLQLLKAKKDEHTSKALQQKNDSLQHFIEAFNIFKNYFESEKLDALQTAEAAIQIAELLEEDNRMEEAFEYAQVASQTYQHIYAQDNPLIIKAMWQELSIAYSIKSPKTEELAADLFYALAKRDYILSIGDIQTFERNMAKQYVSDKPNKSGLLNGSQPVGTNGNDTSKTIRGPNQTGKDTASVTGRMFNQGNNTTQGSNQYNVDHQQDGTSRQGGDGTSAMTNAAIAQQIAAERTNKEIDKIKAYLIATIIMEKTRNLKVDEKKNIKAFCDKEMFYEMYEKEGDFKEKKEDIIANLQRFHYTNLNPLRVESVRNLDIHDRANQLLLMYNQAAKKINWLVPEDLAELENRKNVFHERYMKMINHVNEKENESKLQKSQAHPGTSLNFDESNIILDRQGGDGFNDMNLKGADDFVPEDYNMFGSYVDAVTGTNGGPPGLHEMPNGENENCRKFFRKLIKIFKNINFYNLIQPTYEQERKDSQQIGIDDNQ